MLQKFLPQLHMHLTRCVFTASDAIKISDSKLEPNKEQTVIPQITTWWKNTNLVQEEQNDIQEENDVQIVRWAQEDESDKERDIRPWF